MVLCIATYTEEELKYCIPILLSVLLQFAAYGFSDHHYDDDRNGDSLWVVYTTPYNRTVWQAKISHVDYEDEDKEKWVVNFGTAVKLSQKAILTGDFVNLNGMHPVYRSMEGNEEGDKEVAVGLERILVPSWRFGFSAATTRYDGNIIVLGISRSFSK